MQPCATGPGNPSPARSRALSRRVVIGVRCARARHEAHLDRQDRILGVHVVVQDHVQNGAVVGIHVGASHSLSGCARDTWLRVAVVGSATSAAATGTATVAAAAAGAVAAAPAAAATATSIIAPVAPSETGALRAARTKQPGD
eukprot:359821-Chlamydomonas_euryale.AAC.6